MRSLMSFAALLLSVLLVQLSSGGGGPLDALSGLAPISLPPGSGCWDQPISPAFSWGAGGRRACWARSAIRARAHHGRLRERKQLVLE